MPPSNRAAATHGTTLRARLTDAVLEALRQVLGDAVPGNDTPRVTLSPPKQAAHGDYSCTAALAVAKKLRQPPRAIAEALQGALGDAGGLLEKTEIAGPGYLNLFVARHAWLAELLRVLTSAAYVRSDIGRGERVLLEYVSANPTGPLHVAHGRGAVMGDTLARMLRAAGYGAEREYYVNDLGNQIDVMAQSIYLRFAEACGVPFEPPENFYPGEYIGDLAKAWLKEHGKKLLDTAPDVYLPVLRDFGVEAMLLRIKDDLRRFGVDYDHFVSERALTGALDLPGMVARLEKAGHIYSKDGKKWFASTNFGDDKDRVVIREDGRPTYFASDIAYHDHKMRRGFARLVNVWGADHGGYVTRVRAGLAALGHDPNAMTVVLMQMVSLTRGGAAVRMGKRLGTAVWLREVIDEAGKDATRYLFLMRRADAQMEFDLSLATQKSIDNPVFYAQMGYARLCGIGRRARDNGVAVPEPSLAALRALVLPEEIDLIKSMAQAPDVLADAALALEPHQLIHYLQALIGQFHSYYTKYKNTDRVVGVDAQKTAARLMLCRALSQVLKELLTLLGVDAPERMTLSDAASEAS